MSNHVYPNDDDGEEEWQPIGIAISDTLMDVIMPIQKGIPNRFICKYAPYCAGPSIQNHGLCKGFFRDYIQFPPYRMILETDPCSDESSLPICIPKLISKDM